VIVTEGLPAELADDAEDVPAATPLLEPRDGLTPVVTDADALAETVAAFASGTGPVAVDAERASGYRYGQAAYLVQLRRAGAGTALVDPVGCPDLTALGEVLADTEWVLHAASQDLACLADVGMRPRRIFDTELGARLAGHARVGLGPLVEEVLGLALEKGHSAADWSTRPLPDPWLRYAALDVEVLVELRDALHAELSEQGKLEWALEEFAAVLAAPPPPPRVDPWRRTSGLHRVRGARGLATVRSMWRARDALARQRDTAPGRVLSDSAIVEAALAKPKTVEALFAVAGFSGRGARRHGDLWFAALQDAYVLPEDELPALTLTSDAPPPARSWPERDPAAAARLAASRTAVAAIADEHRLPVENLLSPDFVRRLCWTPPTELDEDAVADVLRGLGARSWQVALTAPVLASALRRVRDQPT
jgi:ribonuclease D